MIVFLGEALIKIGLLIAFICAMMTCHLTLILASFSVIFSRF